MKSSGSFGFLFSFPDNIRKLTILLNNKIPDTGVHIYNLNLMIRAALSRGLYRSLTNKNARFISKYTFDRDIPSTAQRKKMNLFTAVNDAMDIALATDKT